MRFGSDWMRKSRLIPLLATVTLAGCASGVTVAPVHRVAAYTGHEYDLAAAAGDFTTVVVGNPFGGDNAVFARRVTTLLNEQNALQRTNFTTQPGPAARKQFRLVLVFNSPRASEHSLCEDPQALRGGPAGVTPITVQAAFCNGAASMIDVYALAAGGEEAQFRALIGQVQLAVFPSRQGIGFAGIN